MKKNILIAILLLPIAGWVALVITYTGGFGGGVVWWRAALGILAALLMVSSPFRSSPRSALIFSGSILVSTFFFWVSHQPSNARDWSPIASKTAWAEINGSEVVFNNVRNFRHNEDGTFEPDWYQATYNVEEIEQAYLLLTTFGGVEGLAHVMVSFRFKGEKYLIMSVEIRREMGEEYHPVGGTFRQFELYYVVADERDALALRTHVHKDPTWVIPMNAGPEKTGEFFMDMVRRANSLHAEPQWYNSITSSCASNLATHYEVINEVSLPPDYRILLPGFSGELLAELDLLPEGMSVEDAMATFRVDELARAQPLDENFSTAIRANFPK